ncbi:MAG TPA: hypothetical protein GXX46_03810 [Peptococcaceae bacterium]|nr:hypothetical protein [Peptococcaceae bacterium]
MAALDVTHIDSNYLNYSTGLLVSILLRYPEVGTISCCRENQALVLKFVVRKGFDFDSLSQKIYLALEMFHKLEGCPMKLCTLEKHEQDLDLIVITRDLMSFTQNEMNLIVEIMKSELKNQLVCDESSLEEEEILFQEEVINHMLAALRANGTERNITAVREDGRVLVFNG